MVQAPAGHEPAAQTGAAADEGAVFRITSTQHISATPATPVAPLPEAGADASRPPRSFKFREDFVPPTEPLAAKGPRGPKIPDPPRTAGPAAQVPQAVPTADSTTGDPSRTGSRSRLKHGLLIGGAALLGIVLALLVVVVLAARRSDELPPTPPPAEASPSAMPSVPERAVAPDEKTPSDTAPVKNCPRCHSQQTQTQLPTERPRPQRELRDRIRNPPRRRELPHPRST